jgi:hypothetical protein
MPTFFGLSLLINLFMDGLVSKLSVWDGLQYYLPFNSRFLDVDGPKLCEKSALVMRMGIGLGIFENI